MDHCVRTRLYWLETEFFRKSERSIVRNKSLYVSDLINLASLYTWAHYFEID
jgi:hypothetical protein